MKFISSKVIELNRELSDLDLFTLEFVKLLRKYAKYVLVSGYVSILLGRARSSEDVDIITPKIEFQKFKQLTNELSQNGFYCLNAESDEEIYSYLNEQEVVRFAKKGTAIPNMELKFAKNKIDELALNNSIKVKLNKEELLISELEMQIAFKEIVLKSPKDIEDARHIRNVAKGHIDNELIKKYEMMFNGI
jgi:hypothetical protein